MPSPNPPAALLAGIIQSSEDAIVGETADGVIILWNPSAERLFGYTTGEALGQSIDLLVPEQARNEAQSARARALRGDRVDHFETRLRTKSHGLIEASLTISAMHDVERRPLGLSYIIRDVSQQRAMERQVIHLAAVIHSSDDAIATKDLNGTVQSWNPAAERLFGYATEEIVGESIRMIIPPDRWREEDDVLRRVRAGERIEHFETIRQRKDATLVPISLTVSPIHSSNGQIVGASTSARDITTQALLERTRNRLGAIVDSSDDAIVSKDLNGIIQSWNRAAERMFGYTASEAIGQSITLLIPRTG